MATMNDLGPQERRLTGLVHKGPAITDPEPIEDGLGDPVWIRMIGQSGRAVAACRFDVLVMSLGKIEQFQFTCAAAKPPQPAKLGGFYLPEPNGVSSVSMQVERGELVEKLRALANTIDDSPR